MTERRRRKLTLQVQSQRSDGLGRSPHLHGHRKNAAGNYEHYELELEACRHSVRLLLAEVRKMHLRDRERLAREQRRIELERAELLQEQST